MEERLTRILRRINSTIQVDSQIKMVVTKLTDIVKSLVERSKEGKLRRTHVMAVVTELGQLLSLAPSLYVAETIREILITLVVPARALECLEYVKPVSAGIS
jgi:hypothetical protein